jgi:hypothetical protein
VGALTIAFDTVIVGALALPWVLLLVHLFLFKDENGLLEWFKKQDFGKNQQMAAVTGVLLFGLAYTLGSAMSRIAQDFFNDDDLRVPKLLRMAMTEDRIIASVYCNADRRSLSAAGNPTLAGKIDAFQCLKSNCCKPDTTGEGSHSPDVETAPKETKSVSQLQKPDCCSNDHNVASKATKTTNSAAPAPQPECLCQRILSGKGRYLYDADRQKEKQLIATARDIFGLQENALLLRGEDATLRLRQLHDQIMVLRGATFNGLLAFSFCLFAWGAKERREKPRSLWRWLLALVPAIFLFLAAEAFYHHAQERSIGDPPYMEFSMFMVGAVGAVLLWWPRSRLLASGSPGSGPRWRWAALSLVFAVLFVAGVLGWWSTEVLYGQQVIYSYDAQPPNASQQK